MNQTNQTKFFVLSLIRSKGVNKDRSLWVNDLKNFIPNIEVIPAVDGFDVEGIENELAQLQVPFKQLEHWNYGALGCWLSHYKALKKQVDEKIPFMCRLEDDAEINETFYPSVNALTGRFEKDKELNMIRLARWGEGYITSLDSSRRIIDMLDGKGIINNIDNQLRCDSGKEVGIPLIHSLKCPTNGGDIGNTKQLPEHFAFLAGMRAQKLIKVPQEKAPKVLGTGNE
jgi:hypothetical protein